ncbi:fimbria/pilus chaperone family protein [Cupriavidus lacunae]|uniref:Fimbrial chaperone protein n=1 Tax=Cupriavidus lacunae TaxID=2666307 RepID=A0A370NKV4_9BURK|nr:fimbria/pilus chaperone family protein [Cupriavidus lacunae]RDK06217.1 fimbrial chaperone protein [Cupriavidus lacunae]
MSAVLVVYALGSHAQTQSPVATGLQLETPVVVVNTDDGEGVMTLKNTDARLMLLYASVETIPEDPTDRVMATPPVARLEPGDTQMVRFILKKKEDLTTEKLARAIFEGIPPAVKNTVRMTVRQNVPLIIHPSSLPVNNEPWKALKYSRLANGDVQVQNTGAYVVRMSPNLDLMPGNGRADLPRTYILPGETVVARQGVAPTGTATTVRLMPASVFGYFSKPYDAPLGATAKAAAADVNAAR